MEEYQKVVTCVRGVADVAEEGWYKQLIFPANINGKHWIVVGVDVVRRVFKFGVSYHFMWASTSSSPVNTVQETHSVAILRGGTLRDYARDLGSGCN